MTSRRALIVIGVLAVVHNILRVFVSVTGETWSLLPAFGAFPFTDAQMGCSFVFVLLALFLAQFWLRGDYRATLLPSAGRGAMSGAVISLVSVYLSSTNREKYTFAVFLLTPALMGFHSALDLRSRGKSSVGDAILAGLISLAMLGFAMAVFAFEPAIMWGEGSYLLVPLAALGAFAGYRVRQFIHRPPTALPLLMD